MKTLNVLYLSCNGRASAMNVFHNWLRPISLFNLQMSLGAQSGVAAAAASAAMEEKEPAQKGKLWMCMVPEERIELSGAQGPADFESPPEKS